MNAKRLAPAAVLLTTTALLTACGGSGTAASGKPEVAAAFYPLQWVTEQVAGDAWEVTGLTTPGTEPHDLELGISQTATIDQASVLVVEHGFQPAVDEAVENVSDAVVLDAAEVLELRPAAEDDHDHGDEEHADEEHADEEHADEEAHSEEDGHDHGDTDPHFWHDPLLMADLADTVAETLAEEDPDGATTYEENAADLRSRLEALDQQFTDGLGSCERDTMVVTHDAFGYLEKYGLHFDSIVGLTPDAEPTPAVLAQLQDLIAEEGITTVFSERLASPAMAESLAGDTAITTAVLDPIEGPGEDGDQGDYLSLMEQNLEALRTAGGC